MQIVEEDLRKQVENKKRQKGESSLTNAHLAGENIIMASLQDFEKPNVTEENVTPVDAIEENLQSRFECPICLTWLRDPILTSCGHKFCNQCISDWLKKKGACCPVDNKTLNSESDLFMDLFTKREISQQRTNCPNHQFGCNFASSPIEMESHVGQCEFRKTATESNGIPCTFKSVGCKETFQDDKELGVHLSEKINSHLTMVKDLLPRVMTLSKELETRMWDPPPKHETKTAEEEKARQNCEELLKNLYERVVILEQQNHELSISLSNQQNQLSPMRTLIQYNQEEMMLRNCNGIYIWRLKDIREKLETMLADPLTMYYSPGFYTNQNGYKICARVNISSRDPEYLSLLLHIMQSDNDDALDWPFNGTMYFALFHPTDKSKDIREMTTSMPDLEAFKRPTSNFNKRSFGYTEFVRIAELPEYFRNNTLVFRIEVEPHTCLKDYFEKMT